MRSVFQPPVPAYWLEGGGRAAEHPHDVRKRVGGELNARNYTGKGEELQKPFDWNHGMVWVGRDL